MGNRFSLRGLVLLVSALGGCVLDAQDPDLENAREHEGAEAFDEVTQDSAALQMPSDYVEEQFSDDEFPLDSDDPRAQFGVEAGAYRGALLKKLFYPDERKPVPSTSTYPYSTVVQMFLTWKLPNGTFFRNECTGTMISADAVLTAAHCTYDKSLGGWVYSSRIIPGLDGTYKPFGETVGVRAFNASAYRSATTVVGRYQHDYGVIRTRDKVGSRSGTRSYTVRTSPLNTAMSLLAYHEDIRDRMRQSLGTVEAISSGVFLHHADTGNQASGAGVTTRANLNTIFGVHIAGNSGGNKGVLLNSTSVSNIGSWLRAAL